MSPFQNFIYPQYQQYGTYNPYQQQIQPMPQQMPQTQQFMQSALPMQGIAGKFVDSIESVRATDVLMDGSVMVFPSTDGKNIYTKQLQPDGTSRVLTYTVTEGTQAGESSANIAESVENSLKAFSADIFAGLDDVAERIEKIEKQLRLRGKEIEK